MVAMHHHGYHNTPDILHTIIIVWATKYYYGFILPSVTALLGIMDKAIKHTYTLLSFIVEVLYILSTYILVTS